MTNKELGDFKVIIEPLIKSLEFTLNKFEEDPKFQASFLFPVYELYPQNFKKDENPKHNSPQSYIEQRYELNSEIPLGIIIRGQKCLKLIIEDGKVKSIYTPTLLEFQEEWLFDRDKHENTNKYQILELGQVNSLLYRKLDEKQIIFAATQFYNNYYPYLNERCGLVKHYKGLNEISLSSILAFND